MPLHCAKQRADKQMPFDHRTPVRSLAPKAHIGEESFHSDWDVLVVVALILGGRCRTVRARFNVFGMVAQLVPR